MELNEKGLRERKWWTERGYRLPEFDRKAVREATGREPVWVHFGAGNIFRAFPARAVQELLDQGIFRTFVVLSLAQGKRVYTVRKEGMP